MRRPPPRRTSHWVLLVPFLVECSLAAVIFRFGFGASTDGGTLAFPAPIPSAALRDILACMNYQSNWRRLLTSREQILAEFDRISSVVRDLLPRRIHRARFCYINFCGPWIEDLWLNHISSEELRTSYIGPCVPLAVPWLKMLTSYADRYFTDVQNIFDALDPAFLYVTVTQSADGIEGGDQNATYRAPGNLLVISSGGKGHIPVFLLNAELSYERFPVVRNYQFSLSFMGGIIRRVLREDMVEGLKSCNSCYIGANYRRQNKWKYVAMNSKLNLAPRGFGRNSFRVTEILQMGMVIVYIYNDLVWLPYWDSINWSDFAFVVHINDFAKAVPALEKITEDEVVRRRHKVRSLYHTHFKHAAIIDQMWRFLKFGFAGSDIRCSKWRHYR